MKRPPAVWLTQTLLLFYAVLWAFRILVSLATLVSVGSVSITRAEIGRAIGSGFVLVFLTAFWGLAQRKMYGKWLGVLSLSILWGLSLYVYFYPYIWPNAGPSTGLFMHYEYNSPEEEGAAMIAEVLISAMYLTLILRLALAKEVNDFFRQGD